MQDFIIYSIFFAVVTKLFSLVRKRIKRKIITILYIIILLSPSVFYIPIEINTYLHGYEFSDVDIETGFNLPTVYYKVFSYSDTEAKLFYVEGENGKHQVGKYYTFTKENGVWIMQGWGCFWTDLGGSASETTFPPYF